MSFARPIASPARKPQLTSHTSTNTWRISFSVNRSLSRLFIISMIPPPGREAKAGGEPSRRSALMLFFFGHNEIEQD